jgi:hypothetical protein
MHSSGAWKRLKQLSYLVEAETTPFRDELHDLVYSMQLVDPEYLNLDIDYDEIESARQADLDFRTTAQYITRIYRADRFSEGTVNMAIDNGLIPNLLRHAYSLSLHENGWPRNFDVVDDGKISVGLPVFSLSGKIEGRTTGGRRGCPSHSCSGWLIGVLWETGQMMHICSVGWHYDENKREIQVVGGGEISARFVSPKPSGVPPLPKSQWIKRSELLKRKSWNSIQ